MFKSTKLFAALNALNQKYKVILEADDNKLEDQADTENDSSDDLSSNAFPETAEDDPDNTEIDPTETPEDKDIPDNEKGSYMSDTKLSMLASLLAKAATSNAIKIPSEMLPVTSQNANQVIQYIEKNLQLNNPMNKISNNLNNI